MASHGGSGRQAISVNPLKPGARCMVAFGCFLLPRGGGAPALEHAKALLLQTPPEPSFAKKNPSFEGCCMGNRKTCTCGAPFLG